MMRLEYVGKNIQRTDAVSKVTGATRYANDLSREGMPMENCSDRHTLTHGL